MTGRYGLEGVVAADAMAQSLITRQGEVVQ